MSMILHKPYLVKWLTKGGRGVEMSKNYLRGLWMAPYVTYRINPIQNSVFFNRQKTVDGPCQIVLIFK